MSIFEYVMVLVSVVLSLGLAHILSRLADLLKPGVQVKWSATWLGWVLVIVLIHIDLWGSLWFLHGAAAWSIGGLALVLLTASTIYMASALVTPDVERGEAVDLWKEHLSRRRAVGASLIGYSVGGMLMNAILVPGQFAIANLLYLGPFVGLLLALMFVANKHVQRALPVVILVLMGLYFLQFFPSIG